MPYISWAVWMRGFYQTSKGMKTFLYRSAILSHILYWWVVTRAAFLQFSVWEIDNHTPHPFESLSHILGIYCPFIPVPQSPSCWSWESGLWYMHLFSSPYAAGAIQWPGGIPSSPLAPTWIWVNYGAGYQPGRNWASEHGCLTRTMSDTREWTPGGLWRYCKPFISPGHTDLLQEIPNLPVLWEV